MACFRFVLLALLTYPLLTSCKPTASATNCTSNNITISYNSSYTRKIFQFNCYSTAPVTQMVNPSIPLIFQPNQTLEYNEVDLSPNRFIVIPFTSLCQLSLIHTLDMSANLLTSLNGLYELGTCLTRLESIDLSNNYITTKFTSSLFDDQFASQLKSLNLSNNRIESVESRAFIKRDGTSRFPVLSYLGLAKNLIIHFDLLWPLTLPASNLLVDIKFNQIETLVNELNMTFGDPMFNNPMKNGRYVDATTNKMQYMDDTNLLQYGLSTPNDFYTFLDLISNYDFRQSNLVPTFICYCPPKGLWTVYWYQGFASHVYNTSLPIYNLFCSNYDNKYIFDFPCEVIFLKIVRLRILRGT
jgi:hypothetical protein